MAMPLEIETKYFEDHKEEWMEHCEGKYALIKDPEFAGTFDTMEAAYRAGIERFGVVPFLIKKIQTEEPVQHLPALILGIIHANL
jgi:hypothetical protein